MYEEEAEAEETADGAHCSATPTYTRSFDA
jgi:hypothetical protein